MLISHFGFYDLLILCTCFFSSEKVTEEETNVNVVLSVNRIQRPSFTYTVANPQRGLVWNVNFHLYPTNIFLILDLFKSPCGEAVRSGGGVRRWQREAAVARGGGGERRRRREAAAARGGGGEKRRRREATAARGGGGYRSRSGTGRRRRSVARKMVSSLHLWCD